MKRREKAALLLKEHQAVLKCPLCGQGMEVQANSGLASRYNHCFDLSKKGYLNLLQTQHDSGYSKELFQARGQLCRAGFYDPLLDLLAQVLNRYQTGQQEQPGSQKGLTLLDAGCGEGSHLSGLSRRLEQSPSSVPGENSAHCLYGVDIAKESIQLAAGHPEEIIWLVADLAKLPFQEQCFDGVLNILSPANYKEFERVLKPEGLVLKVVPGPRYLEELRRMLYGQDERAAYSNQQVVDYFAEQLQLVTTENLTYSFELPPQLAEPLIQMTPLTWGEAAEKGNRLHPEALEQITVDLVLLVGK